MIQYYKWIAGFHKGKVEEYLAETETDIYFKSGRLVPKSQVEILVLQATEEEFNAANAIQKTNESLYAQEWAAILGNDPILQASNLPQPQIQTPIVEKSPITIILEKQKKLNRVQIVLDVDVELPDHKVVDLLKVMFDEDEVAQEIYTWSANKIDTNQITDKIKEQILNKINSYEM